MVSDNLEPVDGFRETASVLLETWRKGYFSLVKKSSLLQDMGEESNVSLEERWGHAIEEREEKFGDVAGFWHTHPIDAEFISSVDTATARAFSYSYGKKMLMIIETDSGWRRSWFVSENDLISNVKVLKVPFVKDTFLVFRF